MTSPGGTWSRFNQVAETSLYDDLSILRGRKHTDDYYRLGDTNFYSKGIIPLVFILPDLRPGDAVIKFQYLRNRKYITRVLDIRNFMTNLSRVYFQRKKKKKREREFFEISAIVRVEFRTAPSVGVESSVVGGKKDALRDNWRFVFRGALYQW